MMKSIFNIINKSERGQALLIVLTLLLVGGIMLIPLLSLVGTGLKASPVYEIKADQLYTADAGIEDAIWKINVDNTTPVQHVESVLGADSLLHDLTLNGVPNNVHYTSADDGAAIDFTYRNYTYTLPAEINGISTTNINIEYLDGISYEVTADSGTMIEAFVTSIFGDYTGITAYNITTPPNEDGEPGYRINGPWPPDPDVGALHGPNGLYPINLWPFAEAIIGYYSIQVDKTNPYPNNNIDLDGGNLTLGTTYINGDFAITNTRKNTTSILTIDGVLYISGRALFDSKFADGLMINMAPGSAIFVESPEVGGGASGTALIVTGTCSFIGSGCVVGIGDIDFSPHMVSSSSDYVLVLSVIGKTQMHPNGDFYGTLAGRSEVFVQNGTVHYGVGPPDADNDGKPDINFPGGDTNENIYGIASWRVI